MVQRIPAAIQIEIGMISQVAQRILISDRVIADTQLILIRPGKDRFNLHCARESGIAIFAFKTE